jgi:hypothetical protein
VNETDIQKVLTSVPVNKTADIVMKPGFQYASPVKIKHRHWEVCPALRPVPADSTFKDYTGQSFGQFTVVGVLAKHGLDKGKPRWVVRCACGHYEARKSQAIYNPNNQDDCCVHCRHVQYLRRHEERQRDMRKQREVEKGEKR